MVPTRVGREQDRCPGGDLLDFVVLLDCNLGEPLDFFVLLQTDDRDIDVHHVLQDFPEGLHLLLYLHDMILHVPEVFAQPRIDGESALSSLIAVSIGRSGVTARWKSMTSRASE